MGEERSDEAQLPFPILGPEALLAKSDKYKAAKALIVKRHRKNLRVLDKVLNVAPPKVPRKKKKKGIEKAAAVAAANELTGSSPGNIKPLEAK